MHINHFRGETRSLVWRNNDANQYKDPWWSEEIHKYKTRRDLCDLEVPQYRKKRGKRNRPYCLQLGDWMRRRYETLEQVLEAKSALRKGWYKKSPIGVRYDPQKR